MNVFNKSAAKTLNQTASGFDVAFFTQLVDNMPTNVLVCDPATLIITYANNTSIETLRLVADELPAGVTPDNIVGQCIDVFHKDPSHQRQLLANPANLPHEAIIRFGPHLLELYIAALHGTDGSVEHLLLSWTIVTERERLKTMINNMPINIMMADAKTLEGLAIGALDKLRERRVFGYLSPVYQESIIEIGNSRNTAPDSAR